MATVLIAGKAIAGLIGLCLVASIKATSKETQTVEDYRKNPEVLDEVLKTL
jgi:hypothetical protein